MTINLAIEYPNKSFDDSNGTIRPGYKQTEVGVIPVDWEVRLVAEAFDICNNLRFPLSAKTREGMSGSYPYYGPTKIQDYLNEYRVEGEFALIGEDGDHFLKFDVMPQTQYATGQFNVNNHAHLIKGKIASAKWFFWFFRNRDISQYLTRQGAGRFKLNKASLESMPCALPPLNEQTAIANALSDVDALIQELEKLIAKKQAIKTATMQQLLTGRTRLPQFAHHPDGRKKGYKPSELGEIPEDWVIKCLGDICYLKSGLSITANELYEHDEYPCYGGNGLRGYTNRFTHEGEYVLVGRQGALCGNVQHVLGCFFASEHALVATPLGGVNSQWLSIYLERMNLNQYSESSAQPGLSAEKLKVLKLITPTGEEQQAVAEVLCEMEDEIHGIEQRLHKTRQIKQGMMQELLTGKTRLV